MAVIGYPYDPAVQDLWLYEDHTVSYSYPSPGTVATKRPVAWNPGSPLYGYRRSLEGISARLRTFSTSAYSSGLSGTAYEAFNNSSLDANKPVYFNSWPMPYFLVSQKFALVCGHCIGSSSGARNPSSFMSGSWYPADSYLVNAQAFRWILHDNSVVSTTAANVISPFTTDSSPALQTYNDLSIVEFPTPVSGVNPIRFVDIRSIQPGSPVWILDSSMKIIRAVAKKAWIQNLVEQFLVRSINFDGTESTLSPFWFLHDSGSIVLAEISPPTDAADGNGVMGIVPGHMYSAGDFDFTAGGAGRPGYGEYSGIGSLATTPPAFVPPTPRIRQYMADRGYPMISSSIGHRTGSDVAMRMTQTDVGTSMENFL